jgi:hypothetical protein
MDHVDPLLCLDLIGLSDPLDNAIWRRTLIEINYINPVEKGAHLDGLWTNITIALSCVCEHN